MVDRMFEALANKHRRRLLVELLDCGSRERVDISELAREDDADLEAFHTQMAHNHLPKLEDMDYVQWNRDTQEVTRGPRFDAIEPSLRLLVSHDDTLPDELV